LASSNDNNTFPSNLEITIINGLRMFNQELIKDKTDQELLLAIRKIGNQQKKKEDS
jgi:hypothetical protein